MVPGVKDESTTDFFVSYTQVDRRWAEWIAWQLEAAGYRVVIQAWDFSAGSNFVVEMDKAVTSAVRTIAVLSPDYGSSRFAKSEWAAAFAADPTGQGRRLLPVRVGEFAVAGLLGQLGWIDIFDCDEQTATERLLASVSNSRSKPSRKPAFPGSGHGEHVAKPDFPAALPSIWNVPARNRNFTGRADWLDRVGSELKGGERAVVTQAISGLGGIGKSQLAIEYAHRQAAMYRLVWWIRAETREARHSDLVDLGRRLSLPELDILPVDSQIALLRSWLEQNSGWLLIFDNVDTPNDILELLPNTGAGHVLVTSRYSAWGNLANVISLGVWAPHEATTYLLKRTGQGDETAAQTLAHTLGYLPLAVEQAAAYIDESQIAIAQYSELFLTSRAQLLKASSSSKVTVATIWTLSLKAVGMQSRDAVTVLQLFAFLPPDSFPRDQLRRTAHTLPGSFAKVLGNDLALNDAIAVLRRYSLMQATPDHVTVHRLVQAVVQEALSDSEHRVFAKAAYQIQHGSVETTLDGGDAGNEIPGALAVGNDTIQTQESTVPIAAERTASGLLGVKGAWLAAAVGVVAIIWAIVSYNSPGQSGASDRPQSLPGANAALVSPLTNDTGEEIVSWVDGQIVTDWATEIAKRERALEGYLNDTDPVRAEKYGFRSGQNPQLAWSWFRDNPVGFNGIPYVLFKTILDLDPDHADPTLRSIARIWKREATVPAGSGTTATRWTFDHIGIGPNPSDYVDGVARPAHERQSPLPFGFAFENPRSFAPLSASETTIYDERLLARRVFQNASLLIAKFRAAGTEDLWERDRPGFGNPGRMDRVFFSCAACHVGRVMASGRVKFLPGMPNTEIEAQYFSKLLMLTGAALVESGFDTSSTVPVNSANIQPNTSAVRALYTEMLDKARQHPETLYGSSSSQIARAKIQTLEVADEFPSVMGDLIAVGVKTHFVYHVVAKNNGYTQPLPDVFEDRPGQMDAFGIAAGFVAFHSRRLANSFLEFVRRDNPKNPFFSGFSKANGLPADVPGMSEPVTDVRMAADRIFKSMSAWAPPVPAPIDLKSVNWTLDRYHANWDGNQGASSQILASDTSATGDPRMANVRIHEPLTPFVDNLPPPPYPFASVDLARAREGKALFKANCATCHTPRNQAIYPVSALGVDPNRTMVNTSVSRFGLGALLMETCQIYGLNTQGQPGADWCVPKGDWEARLDEYFRDTPRRVAEGTNGYKADMLHGIWAQAPYLHNGSVPTLGQLVCAATRPRRFLRGNLYYDEALVGFEWSDRPKARYAPNDTILIKEYDTTVPGKANTGHTYGADLCPDTSGLDPMTDRKEIEARLLGSRVGALLAYLKTL